jgi:2-polyprenyl-3-methyl-5-hydroxy-6-metoxy-1,4-benzoquinol methylase
MIKDYRKKREESMKTEAPASHWLEWNLRYLQTYQKIVGNKFQSPILDLGCGTDDFSKALRQVGYQAEGIDNDRVDFEKDILPYANNFFQIVHFNAVLEHIKNPEHIMLEIRRILKPGGLVIINTPNWQLDFKNFYNDPTHVKPYTPQSLAMLLKMYDFKVLFLGPGLICKPGFYWKLPDFMKWKIAAWIRGGSKSILCLAQKSA